MSRILGVLLVGFLLLVAAPSSVAQEGRITLTARAPFAQTVAAMEQAITDAGMALVCHANAQRGAAARGVSIRGNQVMMVFRNDFAVRLLAAEPAAGFEAPIRIYLHENADGTTSVSYVPPSMLFALYRHPEVRAVAAELDPIIRGIVDRAVGPR